MGQVMKLGDVIDRLAECDSEDTIYAAEPWTEQSEAIVLREPDTGGLPSEALDNDMKYLLEVSIARDFIKDWISFLKEHPAPSVLCQRVIEYAINDA